MLWSGESGEVLPASGLQLRRAFAGVMEGDERLSRTSAMECADAGNGDTRDLTRNTCGRGYSEEKLVVLASMERGVKRLFRGERMSKRVKGDRTGVDLGADA
jgi:hypothetical protein